VYVGALAIGGTFALFGRTASAGVGLPYAWAKVSGRVFEEARTVERAGLADARARGPPEERERAAYRERADVHLGIDVGDGARRLEHDAPGGEEHRDAGERDADRVRGVRTRLELLGAGHARRGHDNAYRAEPNAQAHITAASGEG
jgi:hypothetical protein